MPIALARRRLRFRGALMWVAATLAAASVPLLPSDVSARPRSEPVPGAGPAGQAGTQPAPATKDPLVVVVSLKRQRLNVYNRNGGVAESPISSGNASFPTVTGIFSIIEKNVDHVSNIYEGAEMPYMQRLTWSGTAMHAGHLPGYPASHGCIRLPHGFSKRLFEMTSMNTRVIVTNGEAVPQTIAHPKLPAPLAPQTDDVNVAATIGSRVASLAGIGTAYAAPRPVYEGDIPLSAPAKARFASTQKLFDAIRPLEEAHEAATQSMKAAIKAVNLARLEVTRFNAGSADETVARIRRAQAALEAELQTIGRKVLGAKTDGEREALAKAEDAAEARMFELADRLEAANEARASAKEQRAALEAKVEAAEAARAEAAEGQRAASLALRDARAAFNLQKREDTRYMRPVSVLVSRKDQRLYVRQGLEPLLEVPVVIDNPETPIGTHVYTAMGYRDGGAAIDWTVVSLSSRAAEATPPAKRGMLSAAAALDRVQIPPEALAVLAERVKPGSSLIISDETTSHHFGKGTDFTVNTR